MSLVINTNAAATAASNNLAASNVALQRSLNRLSSGSKIVSPADDAGGLAVSMKLSAAARRQGAAITNVANGVSFLQTQDGALKVAGRVLDRISELKTLSSDPTKSSSDIANYNTEFLTLQTQLESLGDESFNGVALFGSSTFGVSTSEDGSATVDVGGIELLGTPAFPALNESFADLSNWTDLSFGALGGTPSVAGGVLSLEGDIGPGTASIRTNDSFSGAMEISMQIQIPSGSSWFELEFGGTVVADLGFEISDSNPHTLRVVLDGAGNASSYLDGATTAFSTTSGLAASGQITLSENVDEVVHIQNFSVQSSTSGGNVAAVTSATALGSLNLSSITTAIQDLATYRATNGAQQSRLGFASELLTTNKANLEAANSRIVDVDVAAESTQLARHNILVQSGTAMLSQANQSTQGILRLLG